MTDDRALHRMKRKSWLEDFAARQTMMDPEVYDALYENREEMYVRDPKADPVTPCHSQGLERLDSYRIKGA